MREMRGLGRGRREVLAGLAALAGVPAAAAIPFASVPPDLVATRFEGIGTRFLWLRLAGVAEEAHVAFRDAAGGLDETALAALSWAFRDRVDGDTSIWMDHRLFDLLAAMQTEATNAFDMPVRITLISGFRTARRNLTIEGAARNSQHIRGRAADLTLTGLPHAETLRIARHLDAHGIGGYASFTHVDVGPPGRRW
jgi:uncharacterized protein YcbK (DUF882 family)